MEKLEFFFIRKAVYVGIWYSLHEMRRGYFLSQAGE